MSLDLAGLDHSSNVVRRQIEEEFRGLSAVFIVHRAGERQKSIEEKRNVIHGKPFGRKVYDAMLMSQSMHNDKSEFLGLIVNERKILHFFDQKHYTAVFFINADEFLVHDNAKHFLIHMAWHALSLYQSLLGKRDIPIEGALPTKIIKPSTDKLAQSKANLQADIFGAIIMEAQGHQKFIEDLARKRSQDTLQIKPGFIAETLPYTIAYEACQLVYDDLKPTLDKNSRLMHQSMELANEVLITYGEDVIEQWWTFSMPAQTMAWLGYSPSQILGYAIYICEDTNVRAIGYQIAELNNIDPDPLAEQTGFNAFGGMDTNERLHLLRCDETIQHAARQVSLQKSADTLYKMALEQDDQLLEGRGFGWSAPALISTAKAYESLDQLNTNLAEDFDMITFLSEHFHTKCSEIPWSQIEKLASEALDIIREGRAKSCYKDIIALTHKIKGDESLIKHFEAQRILAQEFKAQKENDENLSALSNVKDQESPKGMAAYLGDSYLDKDKTIEVVTPVSADTFKNES